MPINLIVKTVPHPNHQQAIDIISRVILKSILKNGGEVYDIKSIQEKESL